MDKIIKKKVACVSGQLALIPEIQSEIPLVEMVDLCQVNVNATVLSMRLQEQVVQGDVIVA